MDLTEAPTNDRQPRVGVVIVAYRSEDTITRCLIPLLVGSIPLQVVLVDNSPTNALKAQVDELPRQWPLTYIFMGNNAGFGAASNLGLDRVTAPLTLFLNPDAWIDDQGLAACIDRINADPDVGLLGCRLVKLDGSLDHACKRNIPTAHSAVRHLLSRRGNSSYRATDLNEFCEGTVGAVNGAFMLGRTAELRAIGGFDESFWMYGEDLDLCIRVARRNKSILYFPAATAVHLKGASSGTVRAWPIHREFYRSMEIFCIKYPETHRPFPRWITVLGIRTAMVATYLINEVKARRTSLRRVQDCPAQEESQVSC